MNKIIVSVDVRMLSVPITGIGRYLTEVLSVLVKEKDIDWILYSHTPIDKDYWLSDNVKIVHSNFRSKFMRMFWAQFILPLYLLKNKSDIFWSPSHRLPIFSIAKIKYFLTVHDLVCFRYPKSMRFTSRILDIILLPISVFKSDYIFSVSDFTKSEIIDVLGVNPDKIIVTKLGFNSNISKKNNSENYFQKDFILFVGTCEPRKNLMNLIEAYSKLPASLRNNYKLIIVGGDGWGGIYPKDLAIKFGVTDNVVYLGYVSDEQLSNLYSSCMFLAFPSFYEGFGLPLIEALSYNKPLLCSFASSIPEIASDAAIYIDPSNVTSIKEGLTKLLTDKQLRIKLSLEASKIYKLFTWERCSEKMLLKFRNH